MPRLNYKKQKEIIMKIEKIKQDFFNKLEKLRFERDKKIQAILDKNKIANIRKTLNK